MSTPEIIANMSRGWNRSPASVVAAAPATGVSAALWSNDGHDVQEIWAKPDPDIHILSLQLRGYTAEEFQNGRLTYRGNISPGSLSLMPAGVAPRAVLNGAWRILHIYVPRVLIEQLGREVGNGELPELKMPANTRDPDMARAGYQMLAEMRECQPLSRLRIDALGQDLAVQLLRRWSNLAATRAVTREPARGGLAPWQVRRVSDYLEDHLANDVTLAELGELLGLSTFHLCRAFKQSTGLPPHRWRHQRRMERGRELLEGTNLSITEIAASVGYDDPSRFASGFRKAFGLSPTDYRRERRS